MAILDAFLACLPFDSLDAEVQSKPTKQTNYEKSNIGR